MNQTEQKAMLEWISRPDFLRRSPSGFWDDIVSEDINDARPIFANIALRLERLSAAYRAASQDRT